MPDSDPTQMTILLNAAQQGDAAAAAALLPLLYDQLRRLAQVRMAGLAPGQTLQATALVHEAYLRLTGKAHVNWEGRRHFFFAAARAMRDILVEHARAKAGPQRGGDRRREPLDHLALAAADTRSIVDVLAVNEALGELEAHDPDIAKLVLLRYFSGLTIAEAAEVLNESERSLERQWRFARAWLHGRLGGFETR